MDPAVPSSSDQSTFIGDFYDSNGSVYHIINEMLMTLLQNRQFVRKLMETIIYCSISISTTGIQPIEFIRNDTLLVQWDHH